MSANPLQQMWIWSPAWNQHYYISPAENAYIFQDGRRLALPAGHPDSVLTTTTGPTPHSAAPARLPSSSTNSIEASSVQSRLRNAASQHILRPQSRPPEIRGGGLPAWQETSNNSTGSFGGTDNLLTGFNALGFLEEPSQSPLIATADASERLYQGYRVPSSPRRFFAFGRCFMILWAEPAGSSEISSSSFTPGRYGEMIHSQVRRFVVIRESKNHCVALPIQTYARQGLGKRGVVKSDHVMIYTGNAPPEPLSEEQPRHGELPMRPVPIRVTPDVSFDRLDPMSRLNLARPHTIDHRLKVKPFGMVHPGSVNALRSEFEAVWTVSGLPAVDRPRIQKHQQTASSRRHQQGELEVESNDRDEEDGDDEDDDDDDDRVSEPDTVITPVHRRATTPADTPDIRIARLALETWKPQVPSQVWDPILRAREDAFERVSLTVPREYYGDVNGTSKLYQLAFEALRRIGYNDVQAQRILR